MNPGRGSRTSLSLMKVSRVQTVKIHLECMIYQHSITSTARTLSVRVPGSGLYSIVESILAEASPEMLLLWPPCDHGTRGEDARLEPLLRRADGSGQLAGVEVCGTESHEQACGRHPITHGLN